ncbi:MAG: BamA/TamA family outer membrane protein [Cyclobacteriaceae bacterium]|jgi:hypothetical protein|nr:BamA/TamA family outer membrane protein [Cyclobacteriaceae bacterium]
MRLAFFLLFILSHPLMAQTTNGAAASKKEKKIALVPMPVLAANPTTGFMFGVAPGATWVTGDTATTSMSSFLGGFIYTTKKQLFTSIRGSAFLENDRWVLTTDVRFNINSQPTYGLSTQPDKFNRTLVASSERVSDGLRNGPPASEMLGFHHLRLHQVVLKRHRESRFFYGLGYHLDVMTSLDDKQLDLVSVPQALTFHYQYQQQKNLPVDGYALSGLSLNASLDSRDNVANPYAGRLASVMFRVNPRWAGSTASSTHLWVEYRDYLPLTKTRPRNLIAFWAYGSFVTSGHMPYMLLPATGWDFYSRSARPYTQGRFRGEDLIYTEAEWRFPLQQQKENLGAVVFVNMTSASSRTEHVSLFRYGQLGYGAGLRYMIDKKSRVNLGADYGRGANGASGFFLNLNEYF